MERAGDGVKIVRQLIPLLLLPLSIVASVLATAPWLRSFPVSVAGGPMYGAAVLGVLVPLVTVRFRPKWLLAAIAVDAAVFVIYTLVVVLQDPTDIGGLAEGLYRGPSQLLTFALPLISPRSLMVAPVAVTWLAGALAGECLARRWYTMLPYTGFLVAFGLAYAGTQRAAGSDFTSARLRETLLAAALLVMLLVMRVAQTWVRQDETAESTQPDGVLPLRGLVIGTVTTLVVALGASLAVQADAFPKRSSAPQRVPSINDSNPLTPLAFTAGLRPRTTKDPAKPVFTVRVDKPSPGYFAIANVDSYDGSGWSFDRTFRPSGGVLPADPDRSLATTSVVTQQYRIAAGALPTGPWMPFLYRPQRVTGVSVNIDPASGMIVPAGRLSSGQSYTVRSGVTTTTFDQVKGATAVADTATPVIDAQLPDGLRTSLTGVVDAFTEETHLPSSPAIPFLQALQEDLRSRYALSGAAQGSARSGSATSTPSVSASPTPGSGSPSPSNTGPAADLAGGTSYADVLASILGSRSGTPEQYATLLALVARTLGVPARVVTGFKVTPPNGATSLTAGQYEVTTADAWSWTEIPLVGAGWVVLDGSPARFTPDNQQTESAAAPPPTTSAPPSKNALITQGNGHAPAPKSDIPPTSSAARSALLIALLIVIGVLVLALLLVLLSRKRVRAARRRRSPDPRARVIGAWQESIDVLTEAGLPEMTTLTSAEIATLTTEQFGEVNGRTVTALGVAANMVAYSPATVVGPAEADAAWSEQRALRKGVRRQLGMRGRLAATMRYHRTRRGGGPISPPSWADSPAARGEVIASAATERRRYRGRRRAH